VRPGVEFGEKPKKDKELGFDGMQFHDDDAVPELDGLKPEGIAEKARTVRGMLEGEGLVAEFVAPRLWEDARGIDGGFTSNDPACRAWAIDRLKCCADTWATAGPCSSSWSKRSARFPRTSSASASPSAITRPWNWRYSST